MPAPSVGRVVHYVSYGTPGGEYSSQCRAAIVAAVVSLEGREAIAAEEENREGAPVVDLCVLNPTGLFFNRCHQSETDKRGGTWHWPERTTD